MGTTGLIFASAVYSVFVGDNYRLSALLTVFSYAGAFIFALCLEEMKGENRLRRVLGPITLTSLGVGAIIGAGIFVATGEAAHNIAGPALMLSYVVAGITCIFAALCYAEFASMVPIAGSAYTYAYATLGELFAWIIGWDLVLEYAVGAATVANGWSSYFQSVIAKFHLAFPDALSKAQASDLDAGLSEPEAVRRLVTYGPNDLPEAPPPSILKLFLSQFTSVIIWVLIGAAVVSGLLAEWLDAAAIIAIVFLNGLLGFVQEFRAEQSLAALRKMSVAMARVVRDGVLRPIPASELVPGDLVLLEAGDRVPADARLTYSTNFQTQEASLTGESTPVQKDACVLTGADLPLADRTNMAFMGTIAVSGKARVLVVSTGVRTELGRIATMIQQASEAERTETPLQRRLEQFGYTLLWLSLAVVAVVFDVRSGRIPNGLTFGGALAALVYAFAAGGATGVLQASAGWVIGAALFFPFFALGGMGAGDVKLLAAICSWVRISTGTAF